MAGLAPQPCPHGDPRCPCHFDTLVCNYEDVGDSKRSRCPKTGTFDCDCAAKAHRARIRSWVSAGPDRSFRSYVAVCACGWEGRIEYDETTAAGHHAAHAAKEPRSGRRPEQVAADEETANLLSGLIDQLKEAGLDEKGREAWREAGLPQRSAGHLMQAEAEKALDVLGRVWSERPL